MNNTSSTKTTTSYSIILVVAGAHLINDLIQFLVPALYPLFKDNFDLTYLQLGLITLAQQITACVLQPVMGLYGDVRPKPLTLAVSLVIVALGVMLKAWLEPWVTETEPLGEMLPPVPALAVIV